jgi:hypothetical protein
MVGLLTELLTSSPAAFEDAGELALLAGSALRALDALGLDVKAPEPPVAKRDAKPVKAKTSKSGKVHLIGLRGGPACGAKWSSADGSGGASALDGVTCENCKRVGPAILEQMANAKKNRKAKKKPAARKKASQKGAKKGRD